jgi:hypothetical protein
MARQSRSPALFCALLALALLSLAAAATAANPLGLAVAGAPSMFVLAVAEATGNTRDGAGARQAGAEDPRQPRQDALPAQAEPDRQAAAHAAARGSAGERTLANDRKVTLR